MKEKTYLTEIQGALVKAIKDAQKLGDKKVLFEGIQKIVQEFDAFLGSGLPETVRSLKRHAESNTSDFAFSYSDVDLKGLLLHLEEHMPQTKKSLVELLSSLFENLLKVRISKQCPICEAPELTCMLRANDRMPVLYCDECDSVFLLNGTEVHDDIQLTTPRREEVQKFRVPDF